MNRFPIRRSLPLALLALFALAVLLVPQPAFALPPDCSCQRCVPNPNLVCADPYGFDVMYCRDWPDRELCPGAFAQAPEGDDMAALPAVTAPACDVTATPAALPADAR